MPINLNDPREASKIGESIYDRLYRAEYEKHHQGKYVAINIDDESATLGDSASEALAEAKQRHPHGFFHLIRVGHAGAFEVGLAYKNVTPDRQHG